MKSMGTICNSHKSLYRDFLSTRPNRLREPLAVSLLLWSRGGLVNGFGCYPSDFTLCRDFLSMKIQILGETPHTSSIASQ